MTNKFYKYLILIFALQNFIFPSIKSISGFVLDFETHEPINNANVYIITNEIGAVTNQDGYFLLNTEGTNQKKFNLNIEIIGYEVKSILIDVTEHFSCTTCNVSDLGEIFIKKQTIELEPIEIHSHNIYISNQISDIIIDESELNENLRGNIATTLSNYPNIGINAFGSVVAKPALRGFSGDRFLLTKDGDETGDLSQSSIDHVITLDMSEVSQIEIIRGPKSLLYGGNTIGGVVNTNLIGDSKIRVNKIYQRYLIGGESFNNGIYGNMMFYIPILQNNQINLFISNKNTKNEISSIGELDNTQSNIVNYKMKITNYNDKGYVNYLSENFNMNYGIPPNIGGHISGVDILLNKKTEQISYHQDISMFLFNQLDIKYNFIKYIHLELVNNSVNNNDITEIFDSGDYHLALSKKTHQFQIEFSSDKSVFGFEFNKKDFIPYGFYLTPRTKESYLSIYAFNEKKILKNNFDFLSSFRLGYLTVNPEGDQVQYVNLNSDDVKKRNFKTASLSFGFRKNINQTELNSWFMYTMRAPRVEELYSDGPHLGTYSYEIGNPNLEVERIYGIENSLSFNNNPFKISLVTFYNYSPYYYEMAKMGDCEEALEWDPMSGTSHPCAGADFIDWGSGEFGFLYKYNSRGSKATIKGLEIDLEYKLKEDLKLNYNFSFVDGENKTINQPLSYMNPTKQILSFNYIKNKINYKIRFSKIHAQDKLGEFETYTPGSFLTDFIFSYNNKGNDIVLQLNNIFDIEYYNHLSRIKNIAPEPGRSVNFIYKVRI